jgi:hypothetical protein
LARPPSRRYFDGRDGRIAEAVDRSDAGTDRDAVDMHGARPAQRDSAAELRAGHAEHVAQHPQEWRVAIDIDAVRLTVDFYSEDHASLLFDQGLYATRT